MYELTVLLGGIALIIYAFYKYVTLNNDYFKKLGISYIEPTFFVGNSRSIFKKNVALGEVHQQMYNSLPSKKIIGMFHFRQPVFLIRDPEIVKKIGIKDFDYFENRRKFIDETTDKLLGNSLFMMRGKKWREMRATLSPAFTGSKMRQMFGLVVECADEMAKHFIQKAKNGEEIKCEMKDVFSRYTNDVIATTAFGIKVNSFIDKDNTFFKTGQSFLNVPNFKIFLKLIFFQMAPFVMKLLDIEFMAKSISKFFRSMALDTIAVREQEGIVRPDMINILMQVKKGNSNMQQDQSDDTSNNAFATVEESYIGKMDVKRKWNNDEIAAQCFLFFLAGFESSSSVLSVLAYELAINVDVQEKLYEEILKTRNSLDGKQLNYDNLQTMDYMDMVISETLRKWPPTAFFDRVCVKDYLYDDGDNTFMIKKGACFMYPVYSLQNDPNYFPNPDKFDPERFNNINKHNIITGTYLPFGVGPRNCIGSRFALMELKAIMYYMILNFRLEPFEKTQIPLRLIISGLGNKAEKGIHLELKLRQ